MSTKSDLYDLAEWAAGAGYPGIAATLTLEALDAEGDAFADPDDGYAGNDPAYLAWCEEQEAIHTGRATELTHCYLCEPNVNLRLQPGAGPLRGVLARGTTRCSDPSETLTLSCGHVVI